MYIRMCCVDLKWIRKSHKLNKFISIFISELAPSVATYYGNRSAAFLMLVNYDKALEDARAAIKLDDNFVKVS